jgi:hypothetical protein
MKKGLAVSVSGKHPQGYCSLALSCALRILPLTPSLFVLLYSSYTGNCATLAGGCAEIDARFVASHFRFLLA